MFAINKIIIITYNINQRKMKGKVQKMIMFVNKGWIDKIPKIGVMRTILELSQKKNTANLTQISIKKNIKMNCKKIIKNKKIKSIF